MLIIFDCDGVLVDSEVLAAEIFSQELQKIGVSVAPLDCLKQFKGQSLAACFDWVEQTFNIALPDNFHTIIAEATTSGFEDKLEPVAGIADVLRYLSNRPLPFCLASNGSPLKIANSLRVTQLDSFFPLSVRFSGEEVASPKPAPDLFNRAAELMGVPNKYCWVVEDSVPGCLAAKRAGMRLIFFNPQNEHAVFEPAFEPDLRCRTMQELKAFVERGALAYE